MNPYQRRCVINTLWKLFYSMGLVNIFLMPMEVHQNSKITSTFFGLAEVKTTRLLKFGRLAYSLLPVAFLVSIVPMVGIDPCFGNLVAAFVSREAKAKALKIQKYTSGLALALFIALVATIAYFKASLLISLFHNIPDHDVPDLIEFVVNHFHLMVLFILTLYLFFELIVKYWSLYRYIKIQEHREAYEFEEING